MRGRADAEDRERRLRDATVLQGGRRKAYRPLPAEERRAALDAGLDAYDRDDWFLAHELLEPAWMGTADLQERAFYQGLIKLAAGHVHLVRGNLAGFAKNLAGARSRLAEAGGGGPWDAGVDLDALRRSVDDRLAALAVAGDAPAGADPIRIPRRRPGAEAVDPVSG